MDFVPAVLQVQHSRQFSNGGLNTGTQWENLWPRSDAITHLIAPVHVMV